MQLIEQGASKTFEPDKYQDDVRERVEALIARKVEGEDITETPEATPKAQVIDLMTALKQSLSVGPSDAGSDPGAAGPDDRRGPKASDDDDAAPADDAQADG
jgi:non-homologous end joining protein Ku